jgi:predicted dehydrogenase
MQKPIKTGLLSYGMSGRIFHAPFLATNPGFDFKAVVERHEKKAGLKYPGIISYNNVEELLKDDSIELVVVNTPNNTHYEFALSALQAGKHVLLEKPATVTSRDLKSLFHYSRKLNRLLMIYQNRRYDSGFLLMKEIIESGKLGSLIEVHLRMDRYRMAIGPKVFTENADIPGNGLLYNLGPHLLDNAISLFGKPLSFQKNTGVFRTGSQVVDYFHFHLHYPNQLNLFLTSGLLMAEPGYGFVVNGARGSFMKFAVDPQEKHLDGGMMPSHPDFGKEGDAYPGKLVTIGEEGQRKIEWLAAPRGNYNGIFTAVYETVRNGLPFPVTEEQVLWQLEMLED